MEGRQRSYVPCPQRRAYFASRSARASAAAALHDIVKDKASRRPANVCRAATALLRHSPPPPDAQQPQQRAPQEPHDEPADRWTHEQAMAVLDALGPLADEVREREQRDFEERSRERVRTSPNGRPDAVLRDPPQASPAQQCSSG